MAILNYGLPAGFLVAWPIFEGVYDIFSIWIYSRYGYKNGNIKKYMTIAGLVLFGIGSILETGHDILLKRFKSNPSNKGKFYDQGFAKYIAYPNYAGYILFRSGQGILSNNILDLTYGVN